LRLRCASCQLLFGSGNHPRYQTVAKRAAARRQRRCIGGVVTRRRGRTWASGSAASGRRRDRHARRMPFQPSWSDPCRPPTSPDLVGERPPDTYATERWDQVRPSSGAFNVTTRPSAQSSEGPLTTIVVTMRMRTCSSSSSSSSTTGPPPQDGTSTTSSVGLTSDTPSGETGPRSVTGTDQPLVPGRTCRRIRLAAGGCCDDGRRRSVHVVPRCWSRRRTPTAVRRFPIGPLGSWSTVNRALPRASITERIPILRLDSSRSVGRREAREHREVLHVPGP
jgi:hypothetical protein